MTEAGLEGEYLDSPDSVGAGHFLGRQRVRGQERGKEERDWA